MITTQKQIGLSALAALALSVGLGASSASAQDFGCTAVNSGVRSLTLTLPPSETDCYEFEAGRAWADEGDRFYAEDTNFATCRADFDNPAATVLGCSDVVRYVNRLVGGVPRAFIYVMSDLNDAPLDITSWPLWLVNDRKMTGGLEVAPQDATFNQTLKFTTFSSTNGSDTVTVKFTSDNKFQEGGPEIPDTTTIANPVPTMGEWALMAFTLLLLGAGVVVIKRHGVPGVGRNIV